MRLLNRAGNLQNIRLLAVKSDKNPDGLPIEVFDKIREGTVKNRAQFYQDFTPPFYGYNGPRAKISQRIEGAAGGGGHDGRNQGPASLHRGFL